jgi:hypothetical protein
MNEEAVAPQEAFKTLARMVVKEHLHLGLLSNAERQLALAWVWAGLPRTSEQAPLNEAGINAALKSQLAGPASFLGTDHVELRRWMVDSGWVQRDGYGRSYRRVERAHLQTSSQALAQVLDGLETAAWTHACREKAATERAQKRAAWEASPQRRPA